MTFPYPGAGSGRFLDGLPLEISTGKQLTSVTAVLRGSRPGPVVLLPRDMDALPLRERTGLPFASRFDGVTHACGHDLHVAMLAGAARLLAEQDLPGSVIFMFQPGEEGHGGARLMIEDGVLDAAGERPVGGLRPACRGLARTRADAVLPGLARSWRPLTR